MIIIYFSRPREFFQDNTEYFFIQTHLLKYPTKMTVSVLSCFFGECDTGDQILQKHLKDRHSVDQQAALLHFFDAGGKRADVT